MGSETIKGRSENIVRELISTACVFVLQQNNASLFHTSNYVTVVVKLCKIKVVPSDFIVMVVIVLISEDLLLSRKIQFT
jgi:hypothetical protein